MLLPKRIWKDIENYEGLYQVSNLGEVRSLNYKRSNQPHKLKVIKCGRYYHVHLRKEGKQKTIYVHRLVAKAFIPNPNNLPLINHKDENGRNNLYTNLEWCTCVYNLNYGSHCDKIAKGRARKVMLLNTGEVFESMSEAERKTGVTRENINTCCRHRCKSAGKHPVTGEKLVWRYYPLDNE